MTGSPPPALVRSPVDLDEYHVEDASPVSANEGNRSPYSERFIHQGIIKQCPSQQSMVHPHSRSVVPFGVAVVSLMPTYHLTGFIGQEAPVFDIADYYLPNDTEHNLLVDEQRFGDALARTLLTPSHNESHANITEPDHNLILQRGHGFADVGTSLPEAVYHAVYAKWDADVQASALTINHAASIGGGVQYLKPQEVAGTLPTDNSDYVKDWLLWAAQVGANPLYKNELGYAAPSELLM